MNVFLLSRDHDERAKYHCDIHVNKMLLESVQLLNTALRLNDAHDHDVFYQSTHVDHPWTKWAADRHSNWFWLFEHARALGREFYRRSESDSHATIEKMSSYWIDRFESMDEMERVFRSYDFDDGERTSFPQTMPDEYVDRSDPIGAYREYYVAEKVPQDWCSWSTEIPEWVLDKQ